MTLNDIIVNLKLNITEFTSGLAGAQTAVTGYFSNLKTAFGEAGDWLGNNASTIMQGGLAMSAGITAPIAALGAGSLAAAGTMESLKMGLSAVGGGAEEANREFVRLIEVAKLPGLGLEEAVRGSVQLQAVGYSADEARQALLGFGSAIATTGGGRAELDRVILQLGQMANAGKILTADLRPVIQTVPLMGSVMQDLFGTVNAAEIDVKLQAMGLSSKDFVGMISAEFNKLPGVAGGIRNATENMSDAVKIAMADLGKVLIPFMATFVEVAVPAIRAVVDGFLALPEPVQNITVVLAGLAAAVGPVLVALAGFSMSISAIGPLLGTTGLTATLSALLPILGWVAAAAAAVWAAWELWKLKPVQDAVQAVWDVIKGFWSETLEPFLISVWDAGAAFAQWAADIGGSGLSLLWDSLKTAMGGLLDLAADAWNSYLKPMWDGLVQVKDVVVAVGTAIGTFLSTHLSPLLTKVAEAGGVFVKWYLDIYTSGLLLVWEALKTGLSALIGMAGTAYDSFLKPMWDGLVNIKTALDPILQPLKDLGGAIVYLMGLAFITYLQMWWDVAKGLWEILGTLVTEGIVPLGTEMGVVGSAVLGFLSSALQPLWDAFVEVGSYIAGGFQQALANMGEFFTTVIKPAFDAAISGVASFLEWILKLPGVRELVEASKKAFGDLKDEVGKAKDASKDLATEQGKVGAAASSTKSDISGLKTETGGAATEAGKASSKYSEMAEKLKGAHGEVKTAKERKKELTEQMKATKAAANELKSAFGQFELGTKTATDKVTAMKNAMKLLKESGEFAKLSHDDQKAAMDQLREAINKAEGYTIQWKNAMWQLTQEGKGMSTMTYDLKTKIDELPVPKLITDMADLTLKMASADGKTQALSSSYSTLGITSKTETDKIVADANRARDAILGSDLATDFEKKTAVYKALKVQVEAAKQAGIDIPAEQTAMLKKMEQELSGTGDAADKSWSLENLKSKWAGFGTAVSTSMTNLSQKLVDVLWDSDKSWAQKGLTMLDTLGKAVGTAFIEPATTAITGFVTDIIEDMLQKAIGKISGWFADAFSSSAIKAAGGDLIDWAVGQGVTSAASGAASVIGGTADVGGDLIDWAGSAGAFGSAAGSAGGGVAGAVGTAASTALGVIGAVGSVGSMISGIIGNFQSAKMETTLNAIEESTRWMKIDIHNLLPPITNIFAPALPAIHDRLKEMRELGLGVYLQPGWNFGELPDIDTSLDTIAGWGLGGKLDTIANRLSDIKGNVTINVSVGASESSAEGIAAAIATALRGEGVPA